jgi:hypothetical protein
MVPDMPNSSSPLILPPLRCVNVNIRGSNWVRGALNWGPMTWLNAVAKTYGAWPLRRGSYDTDFHTYALEWDESFMYVVSSSRGLLFISRCHHRRIYVDSRLNHMLTLKMDKTFWDRGDFPPVVQNGSQTVILNNPWVNGTKAAPFDQCEFDHPRNAIRSVINSSLFIAFYLILDVAVGGTNGWFPDGGNKPWLDGSQSTSSIYI